MKKIILIILLISIYLTSCCSNTKTPDLNSAKSSSFANYNVNKLYPEGFNKKEIVSCAKAIDDVTEYFENSENIFFTIDKVDFINDRVYYIVRRYENLPERMVTLGLYAVDILTGEVLNTNFLTDLEKME